MSHTRTQAASLSQRKSTRQATPTNAYFDTYHKMNDLMQTMQNLDVPYTTSKPSLKSKSKGPGGINLSALRFTGMDNPTMISPKANPSPLAREMERLSGSLESGADLKHVNFSIAIDDVKQPGKYGSGLSSPKGSSNNITNEAYPPRNYKLKAKLSYEK